MLFACLSKSFLPGEVQLGNESLLPTITDSEVLLPSSLSGQAGSQSTSSVSAGVKPLQHVSKPLVQCVNQGPYTSSLSTTSHVELPSDSFVQSIRTLQGEESRKQAWKSLVRDFISVDSYDENVQWKTLLDKLICVFHEQGKSHWKELILELKTAAKQMGKLDDFMGLSDLVRKMRYFACKVVDPELGLMVFDFHSRLVALEKFKRSKDCDEDDTYLEYRKLGVHSECAEVGSAAVRRLEHCVTIKYSEKRDYYFSFLAKELCGIIHRTKNYEVASLAWQIFERSGLHNATRYLRHEDLVAMTNIAQQAIIPHFALVALEAIKNIHQAGRCDNYSKTRNAFAGRLEYITGCARNRVVNIAAWKMFVELFGSQHDFGGLSRDELSGKLKEVIIYSEFSDIGLEAFEKLVKLAPTSDPETGQPSMQQLIDDLVDIVLRARNSCMAFQSLVILSKLVGEFESLESKLMLEDLFKKITELAVRVNCPPHLSTPMAQFILLRCQQVYPQHKDLIDKLVKEKKLELDSTNITKLFNVAVKCDIDLKVKKIRNRDFDRVELFHYLATLPKAVKEVLDQTTIESIATAISDPKPVQESHWQLLQLATSASLGRWESMDALGQTALPPIVLASKLESSQQNIDFAALGLLSEISQIAANLEASNLESDQDSDAESELIPNQEEEQFFNDISLSDSRIVASNAHMKFLSTILHTC